MRQRGLLILSFVAGATVMASEMAASRLIAPHFGSTTPVWGTLIAFVLTAMAAGAYLGGRAADRWPRAELLAGALVAASALLSALPFLARWSLGPAAQALLSGSWVGALGRLAVLAAVAALPLLILGATGPFLIRVAGADGGLGRRAGSLSAASNAGSILGTLLAAMVVLPTVGTARTVALFAAVLAGCSAAALRPRWMALGLAVPAAALLFGPVALPRHPLAVDAVESAHALVQTLEHPDGRKELILDQSYAVQSTWRPGRPVTGEVFGHYLLAPAMRADRQAPPRVLLLGLGAGTAARGLLETYPGARIVGVELDEEVVRMARRHFGLPAEVEVHVADARTFLAQNREQFDAIVVDAFRFPYIPFHLVTLEFDALLARSLAPGGVVCVNVGRYGAEKQVVDAVAGTLASVFPEVVGADARNHSNTLLYAGAPGLIERLRESRRALPLVHQGFASRVAGELAPIAAGAPLTDDHAPVEHLTDAILLRALWRTGGLL